MYCCNDGVLYASCTAILVKNLSAYLVSFLPLKKKASSETLLFKVSADNDLSNCRFSSIS